MKKIEEADDHSHGSSDHEHAAVPADDYDAAPSIDLDAFIDGVGGINLHLKTQNFVFTPENVNTLNVGGEGHAHLYLNGKKVARIYSSWYHLDTSSLSNGTYTVSAELNSNDHGPYTLGGENITDSVTVVIDENDITRAQASH